MPKAFFGELRINMAKQRNLKENSWKIKNFSQGLIWVIKNKVIYIYFQKKRLNINSLNLSKLSIQNRIDVSLDLRFL